MFCFDPQGTCCNEGDQTSSCEARFQQYFQKGCNEQEKGNYHEAAIFFKRCLTIERSNVEVNFRIGEVLRDIGASHGACKYFTQVISLDPNHQAAYSNLGYIKFQLQELEVALKHLQKACALGEAAALWNNIALIFQEMGELDRAIEANLTAIRIDDQFETSYYNLGNIYYELQRIDEAIMMHSKVVQLNPLHSDALYNLGVIHQTKGDVEKALEFFELSAKIDPTFQDARISAETAHNLIKSY